MTNARPTVSVVVPSCGRESLRACLLALSRQKHSGFEVLVVDDGSPDPVTRESVTANDVFELRIIRQENAGPAAARNHGAREARGTILAFTDDDCLPLPEWLSTLCAELKQHPDALVGSLTFNGLPENSWSSASQLIIDLVYDHFNRDPTNAYFLASNNLACRRDLFLEIGGFDTDFPKAGAEDRDFCDRWRMTKRPIRLIREHLVEHRHTQTFRKVCGSSLPLWPRRLSLPSQAKTAGLGIHGRRSGIPPHPRRQGSVAFTRPLRVQPTRECFCLNLLAVG